MHRRDRQSHQARYRAVAVPSAAGVASVFSMEAQDAFWQPRGLKPNP